MQSTKTHSFPPPPKVFKSGDFIIQLCWWSKHFAGLFAASRKGILAFLRKKCIIDLAHFFFIEFPSVNQFWINTTSGHLHLKPVLGFHHIEFTGFDARMSDKGNPNVNVNNVLLGIVQSLLRIIQAKNFCKNCVNTTVWTCQTFCGRESLELSIDVNCIIELTTLH